MEQARKILKEVFGYPNFRSLQEKVIGHILAKKDTLVIMPTGGGKSLCYQIPALIFHGLTIVISPLISLMKDQVEQLRQLDIPAVLLNSSLSSDEYRVNVAKLRRNEVKLLYLAPETLLKPWTLEMLSALPVAVDSITIDEAHCISEWGHDFRPEYRQLIEVRQRFPQAVCIALTATATQRVREDIKHTLHFDQSAEFIDSFDRPNLFLRIVPKDNPNKQVLRLLEKFPDQSGIIYCFSRRQVDELAQELHKQGYSVRPYHAGLAEEERKENQELFIRDEVQIIVATVAFGMGINKSNIRFVIHYDLPKNIESYYQEIGRAGRDGVRAYCLLLFGYADIRKIKYFIDQKDESTQRVATLHLNALLAFVESHLCRRIPLLHYFGEDYHTPNCGMCDNCRQSEKTLADISVPVQKFLSCVRKTGQLFGAAHIIDVLRASKSQKVVKFDHQQLSTYGIGQEFSRKQWLHLSHQLVQKGLLTQDPEYGSLKITDQGMDVLMGRAPFMGIILEDLEKNPPAIKSAKQKVTIDPSMAYDPDLFDLLREARKQQAKLYHIPPYMIFSDRSLLEMAAKMPRTSSAFLNIHGVGTAKMQKFGKVFLNVIADYRPVQKLPPRTSPVSHNSHVPNITQKPREVPIPENSAQISGTNRFQVMGTMFNEGHSIPDISQRFRVKQETVIDTLIKYVQEGHTLRPDGILTLSTLTSQQQAQAAEVFMELGSNHVAPIYNALNGSIDTRQLRILQLYYLCCNS